MGTIDEKLEHFTEMLTSDAMADSQRILEEIKQISAASLEAVEDEALRYAYQHIKTSVAGIHTDASRQISKKEMDNKRVIFSLRLELADGINKEVAQKILAFTQTPEYLKLLVSLSRQAVKAFDGASTVIHLRPQDMHYESELRKALSDQPVEFKAGDVQLGGLRAFCPAKHREIDSTFDVKFEELKTSYFASLPIGNG